jgi:ubiquinone/menaquinone biosynthesis C-methylase UbiE
MNRADMSAESTIDVLSRVLDRITGGWVLDVATGHGGFARVLEAHLEAYEVIVGVDRDIQTLKSARAAMHESTGNSGVKDKIQFIQMDAERLAFSDGSFHIVSIAFSLHHLTNPGHVLTEMKRVLCAPEPADGNTGGHFVISEMHRDAETDAQLTVVRIHHWAAEVDAARGVPHYPTLTRQAIVDLVEGIGLRQATFYDAAIPDPDREDPASAVRRGKEAIHWIAQRAQGLPDWEAFKRRAQELEKRASAVGCQGEPVLIVIGQK